MGGLIAHWGPQKAEQWARGVVANFARPPQGADTTLLQSVAAGECAITLANHYYFVRLQTSKVRGEQDAAKKLTPIFPDQEGRGTHVNISGAGILVSAPHRANAVKFLEFMASDEAQDIVANANYEFPVVGTTKRSRELAALGEFKIDPLNVATYGVNQPQAQAIFDRAGWR
jgi:iron(III) transport system substrate-binding protein